MLGRAQAACADATGTRLSVMNDALGRSTTVVANSDAAPATRTASPRTETRYTGDILSSGILVRRAGRMLGAASASHRTADPPALNGRRPRTRSIRSVRGQIGAASVAFTGRRER